MNSDVARSAHPAAQHPQPPSPVRHFAMRFSSTPRGARLTRRLAGQRLDAWGVLALRHQRAAVWLLGGDYRAALPEFDALADAYARSAGATGEQARACRAQAARCRAELGQVTVALAALQGVLNVVRAVDSDVSVEAVELRHNIGMLLLVQGRAAEARQVLEPLYEDMCAVYGPDDEMTVEIAEALAVIRLGLDGPSSAP